MGSVAGWGPRIGDGPIPGWGPRIGVGVYSRMATQDRCRGLWNDGDPR